VTGTIEGYGSPPSRNRVAEVVVTHPGGRRRGSGYRVCDDVVLTAAHVLADALAVEVRFESDLAGPWCAEATAWDADRESDLATVVIAPRRDEPALTAARFGRVGDRAAVLAVQAVGFPRWKLRTDDGTVPVPGDPRPKYRDACHVAGSVAVLSNWREGTLELTVPPAPTDGEPGVSPWEGMSGAAVWAGERIVGVIAKHHPGDGPARLTAVRIDRAPHGPESPVALRDLVSHRELPDVAPPPPGQLTSTTYQAQLRDIAPGVLHDREPELRELVRFCAEERPYAWWQAGPWAGKSALLSWFVLDPPAGVDVVSFFVTRGFAGQSDSDAFTDALIEQLAALVGEAPRTAREGGTRWGHALRLLNDAATRCGEAGRRLLLVVDGLDEDTSRAAGADRPSIASLLPRRPPPGVRVLVASREHPPLPDDVPGNHPLRTTTPRMLTHSPHARDVEIAAKNELAQLMHGPPFQREILGLITASGGGLTQSDLEELTGCPPYELGDLFDGLFGRSVACRPSPAPALDRAAERVYLFTHATLREIAEHRYGTSLAGFREKLHGWADSYRDRGWPCDTPAYLLRGYPRLLAMTSDLDRLAGCALDRSWYARMLELTGGDALAFSQLTIVAGLVGNQREPDFGALLRLALASDDLAARNRKLPTALPAIWEMMGRESRAEVLAHGIAPADRRVTALGKLTRAVARSGTQDRARTLAVLAENSAHAVRSAASRERAWAAAVEAWAFAGNHEHAEELLGRVASPRVRVDALEALATASASGNPNRTLALAAMLESTAYRVRGPGPRAKALSTAAKAHLAAGTRNRASVLVATAETAAQSIADSYLRVEAYAAVTSALAVTGNGARAVALAATAEATAHHIVDPDLRVDALGSVAAAFAGIGQHDRADRMARRLPDSASRAEALSAVAAALTTAGRPDDAAALAHEAENTIRAIACPGPRAQPMTMAVTALTEAGDCARAERLARHIANPHLRARALVAVIEALADAGDYARAGPLAGEITDPYLRAEAVRTLAAALTAAGHTDRAVELAHAAEVCAEQNPEPGARAWTMSAVSAALAVAGKPYEALCVVCDIAEPGPRFRALGALVGALASAGEHRYAEELARRIEDSLARAEALTSIATALVGEGEYHRARQLLDEITDSSARAAALAAVATALAARGEHGQAEQLAGRIADPAHRVTALIGIATELAAAGDHRRAIELAAGTQEAARGIADPDLRARALSEIAACVLSSSAETDACRAPDAEALSPHRLLAEVICTSSWYHALPAIGRVALPTLRAISDAMLVMSKLDAG
jgi:tetratricopeptide (TPR) repeat protein